MVYQSSISNHPKTTFVNAQMSSVVEIAKIEIYVPMILVKMEQLVF